MIELPGLFRHHGSASFHLAVPVAMVLTFFIGAVVEILLLVNHSQWKNPWTTLIMTFGLLLALRQYHKIFGPFRKPPDYIQMDVFVFASSSTGT
jgi:branched-subunit amino acid ABC-type transport system permease component